MLGGLPLYVMTRKAGAPSPVDVLGARLVRYWADTYSAGVWTEEIAAVNTSQATSGQRPSATTTPAGKTALSFDGTDDSLVIDTGSSFSGSPDRALIFGIFKISNASAINRTLAILRSGSTDTKGAHIYINNESPPKLALGARGGSSTGLVFAKTNDGNDTNWHTFIAKFDADRKVTIYIDGVAQSTVGTVGGTTDIMTTFCAALATSDEGNPGLFGVNWLNEEAYPGILAHWGIAVDSAANFTSQDVTDLHAVLASIVGET